MGSTAKRDFYITETVCNNWTARQMERQINSQLYERLLLSMDRERLLSIAQNEKYPSEPKNIIKDPIVIEFPGLKPEVTYYEKDLETALITHLQALCLNLGMAILLFQR